MHLGLGQRHMCMLSQREIIWFAKHSILLRLFIRYGCRNNHECLGRASTFRRRFKYAHMPAWSGERQINAQPMSGQSRPHWSCKALIYERNKRLRMFRASFSSFVLFFRRLFCCRVVKKGSVWYATKYLQLEICRYVNVTKEARRVYLTTVSERLN